MRNKIVRERDRYRFEVFERLKDGRYDSAAFYAGAYKYLDAVNCLEFKNKEMLWDDARLICSKMISLNQSWNEGIEYAVKFVMRIIKEEKYV